MLNSGKKVRYAVVGLGYIAQAAVLPAFAHARKRPSTVQEISRPPARKPDLVAAEGPSPD